MSKCYQTKLRLLAPFYFPSLSCFAQLDFTLSSLFLLYSACPSYTKLPCLAVITQPNLIIPQTIPDAALYATRAIDLASPQRENGIEGDRRGERRRGYGGGDRAV